MKINSHSYRLVVKNRLTCPEYHSHALFLSQKTIHVLKIPTWSFIVKWRLSEPLQFAFLSFRGYHTMILTKIKSFLQSPLGNKVKAAVNTYWFYGFFALVLFVFLMYSFSFIFGLAKDKKDSFAEEYKALPEVEESRSALPDPDNPLVFHQFVD